MAETIGENFNKDLTYEDVRARMEEFVKERDWEQFHTPRNLLLAFLGEAGELAEIFQWAGEVAPGLPAFDESKKVHVGEELADCSIYLVRIAQQCQINLPAAILRKMERNAMKYPADKVRGSSQKYTAYKTAAAAADAEKAAARAASNLSPRKSAAPAESEASSTPRRLDFGSRSSSGVATSQTAAPPSLQPASQLHWPSVALGFGAALLSVGLGVLATKALSGRSGSVATRS